MLSSPNVFENERINQAIELNQAEDVLRHRQAILERDPLVERPNSNECAPKPIKTSKEFKQ